jgi:DNA repair protein RecN (Recombination protein N)
MLSFLQIRNFAIIESLDLEFGDGFTCISGETGAGKSILVDALGLLGGNRADTSAVRAGAARAELSAGFELPEGSPALCWLRETELDEGTTCLLRRVIGENGRSRAWINGTAVTLQQLASLGALLIEIHGQNEHIRLLQRDEQFRLLDGGGSYDAALEQTRTAFRAWHALESERRALLDDTPLDAGDRDLMRYQIEELESSLLSAEEFAAMESEHRLLARGGELIESLERALQTLAADTDGATPMVHRLAASLQTHADLDPDIAAAVGLLQEASINLEEAVSTLQGARSRLDLSPERLQFLERQLSLQHDLARKHRSEPERLEQVLERLRERFERADTMEARLAELDPLLEDALTDYRAAAGKLSERRAGRADELSAAVTALMQELGMPGGRFEVQLRHHADHHPTVVGNDELHWLVSANPGVEPGPLRKVASGGELSRISLAVKVASQSGGVAAQVFDEVDAGIGGDTAHSVGALLQSLSVGGQALCVTHLAQVAVFADRQIQVLKSADGEQTRVETSLLAEGDRVNEIARMLGGRLSEQSRAHAAELLDSARTRH